MDLTIDSVLTHSPDVAARLVGGRVVLAPLHAEPGDPLDDLFTLNDTGQAIWELVDGSRSVRDIVDALLEDYAHEPVSRGTSPHGGAPRDAMARDVLAFLDDLLIKRMVALR